METKNEEQSSLVRNNPWQQKIVFFISVNIVEV
jgi:hypothetical protein